MRTKKRSNKRKNNNSFITIGNFNYKLSKEEIDFVNEFEIKESNISEICKLNLKLSYLKFKKSQEMKGYNVLLVPFERYLEFYKILIDYKTAYTYTDYNMYSNKVKKYISDISLNQLKIYIDKEIMTKDNDTTIKFVNIYNTNLTLTFKVKDNSRLYLIHYDKSEEFTIYLRSYEKIDPKEFLSKIFINGYFPTNPVIFEYYRTLYGQSTSACKELFYDKTI